MQLSYRWNIHEDICDHSSRTSSPRSGTWTTIPGIFLDNRTNILRFWKIRKLEYKYGYFFAALQNLSTLAAFSFFLTAPDRANFIYWWWIGDDIQLQVSSWLKTLLTLHNLCVSTTTWCATAVRLHRWGNLTTWGTLAIWMFGGQKTRKKDYDDAGSSVERRRVRYRGVQPSPRNRCLGLSHCLGIP